jgi:DMSO/TMAO reductase YedYZ molybdopterin-dependent catalytic subunit
MSEERETTPKEWNRRKWWAFGLFVLFGAGVWGIRQWITEAPKVDGAAAPLRSVLEFNEGLNKTLRSDDHLVKEYPKEMAAQRVRVNGNFGVSSPLDTAAWRLIVRTNRTGADSVLTITLDQLRALPKTEVIFDFKCIEGWSQVTHWGGVRFSDFAKHFLVGSKSGAAPSNDHPDDLYNYMSLVTPDGGYYVGIDMESALHPQTILAYEMNGAPLPLNQGAPLRLIIPTKYGVKNLKRIGVMGFSDSRPRDYWHERGYDYDCAL